MDAERSEVGKLQGADIGVVQAVLSYGALLRDPRFTLDDQGKRNEQGYRLKEFA